MQGNEAARPIFRKWLQPFREMGANTLTISNTGGTDHQSFDGIGLPGFQFIQDEIEYDTRTHHSNQDVFDRIQADDMKQASVIMAAFVYNAAMMDQDTQKTPTIRGKSRKNSGFSVATGVGIPCRKSVTKRPLEDMADRSSATQSATRVLPDDPDFTLVAEVWERLPKNIRKAVVAMIKAATANDE